jgi:hypothetical protein
MKRLDLHHVSAVSRLGRNGAGIAVLAATVARAATNALPTAPELQDIRGPVEIESPWSWLGRVAAVLFVAGLLALAWWWRHRRQASTPPPETTLAPEERARRRLQAALDRIDQPEPFATEVSEIARTYLEERFGLHAPDRTTEEFLVELSDSAAVDARHKTLLADFLTRCDLVKFARAEADRHELEELHAAAGRLVDETAPTHNPAPVTASRSEPPMRS